MATIVTIVASLLQVGYSYLRYKKCQILHAVTLVFVTLFGGATLLLHQPIFIQWKPTAIYWLFTLILWGSQFSQKTVVERLLGQKVKLAPTVWTSINHAWALFFLGLGCLNIYVIYHYSLNTWVNFKLFGTLGLTLFFIVAQTFYIIKHLDTQKALNPSTTNQGALD
jgi:intracellular septation protein